MAVAMDLGLRGTKVNILMLMPPAVLLSLTQESCIFSGILETVKV